MLCIYEVWGRLRGAVTYCTVFLKLLLCICLFLAILGLRCCSGFSLVVSGGYFLVAACGASHCGGFSCCEAEL